MTQSETIRSARQGRNMSQAALAEAARVSERTVKRAEAGHPLSPETAQALSSALGLEPGTLRSGQPGSHPAPALETTMPDDDLAKDPRRAEIEEMLLPGNPFEAVILPDPATLAARMPPDGWLERLFAKSAVVATCAGLVSLAFLLSAMLLPSGLADISAAAAFCTIPVLVMAALILNANLHYGYSKRNAASFACEAILAVEGDLLHVVRLSDGAVTRRTYATGPGVTWTVVRDGPLARHMLSTGETRLDIAGVPARSSLDRLAMGRACPPTPGCAGA